MANYVTCDSASREMENDYFIAMERLENTMDRVIWEWKFVEDTQQKENNKRILSLMPCNVTVPLQLPNSEEFQ